MVEGSGRSEHRAAAVAWIVSLVRGSPQLTPTANVLSPRSLDAVASATYFLGDAKGVPRPTAGRRLGRLPRRCSRSRAHRAR